MTDASAQDQSDASPPDTATGGDSEAPIGDGSTFDATVATTDGACNQVQTDPQNCGYCGHDCQGGACTNGLCQPVTLASGQGEPYGIAIDSTKVYWTNWSPGAVMSVPLGGGTPTTLASDGGVWSLAVDSTSVYWTGSNAVMSLRLSGGTVNTLASMQGGNGTAVDSTSVYWTDWMAGTVMKVPLDGGNVTTLASGQNTPVGIAVDSTSVYWTNEVWNGTVMKIVKN